MYVVPAARGGGIGRQAVIAHVRGMPGITQLNLSHSVASPEAGRLSESVGFRAWGTEPGFMRFDGRSIDEVHMWPRLEE